MSTSVDKRKPALPRRESAVEELHRVYLRDENGKFAHFKSIHGGRRTVFVFLRHFMCYTCIEYLEDMIHISEEELKRLDLQIIVVGLSAPKFIPLIRRNAAVPSYIPIYSDMDNALYDFFGFNKDAPSAWQFFGHLTGLAKEDSMTGKHIKSTMVRGVYWTLMGMKGETAEDLGSVDRNGGQVLLEADGEISFIHREKDVFSGIDILTMMHMIRSGIIGSSPGAGAGSSGDWGELLKPNVRVYFLISYGGVCNPKNCGCA
eukprot:Nk52_evm12s221 gene=Nk52_evmTU12s221